MYLISVLCIVFFANVLAPLGLLHVLNIFAIVILGPVIEEIAKHISIKQNNMWSFFIVFNAFEFTMYVNRMMSMGIPFVVAAFIRLLVVGMHLSTTLVQKNFIDAAGKLNNPSFEKIGLFVGIFMHFLWNSTAVAMSM
jgi:hypothetical protein